MITKLGLQGKSPTISFYRLLKWDRHWEDPEGSGGGGGGSRDWDAEYMYIHGWFMSVYDKSHCNIVKWLASNQ